MLIYNLIWIRTGSGDCSNQPVGSLIVVSDEANHRGVICKIDDGVGSMHRPAVMGVEGVEEWAQHTALWHADVECDGGGAGMAFLTC